MANFNEQITSFFNNNLDEYDCSVLFLRTDGVLVYSNRLLEEIESAAVLIGGSWQASAALLLHFPKEESDSFRFSFDMSDCGVYVLPIIIGDEEYLLGMIYDQTVNPSALKLKFRKLAIKLEDRFYDTFDTGTKKIDSDGKDDSEFLFDEISDNEMDNLFGTL